MTVLTLKGLGVPKLRGRGRGELYVHLQVDTPTDLDDEQRELLARLADLRSRGTGRGTACRGLPLQAALRAELSMGPGRGGVPGSDGRPVAGRARPGAGGRGGHGLRGRPRGTAGRRRRRPAPARRAAPPGRRARGGVRRGRPVGAVPGGCPMPRPGGRAVPMPSSLLVPDGPVVTEPRTGPEVTVAFAPTKGDRPEWVVQKLTELGVDRVVPLRTARSVVRWEGERGDKQVERLRRVAREASAQSRRVWLPRGVGGVPPRCAGRHRRRPARPGRPGGGAPGLDRPVIAVGPEGGWDDDERADVTGSVGLGARPSCGPRPPPSWQVHFCARSVAVLVLPLA